MQIIHTNDGLKAVLELDDAEIKWWRETIGKVRKKNIPPPKESVETFFTNHFDAKSRMIKVDNISSLIREVRGGVWATFIQYEIKFFSEIVGVLVQERDVPKEIMDALITEGTLMRLKDAASRQELVNVISEIYQDYTGRVFPYLYE